MNIAKLKICRVVTVPTAAIQLQDQLNQLAKLGFEITLVSSQFDQYDAKGGASLDSIQLDPKIRRVPITIARNISPLQDLKSLFDLYSFFRENRFDVVHSMTPKAGLLTAIAAYFARVPVRIHTFTGQRWVKTRGLFRFVLKSMDRLMSALMTDLYADSPGQANFLAKEGISQRVQVILDGSIAGVDLGRFNFHKLSPMKTELRKKHGLNPDAFIIIFVGRLTADKGIPELVTAFEEFSSHAPDAELVLLGPTEPDLIRDHGDTLQKIEKNPKIHTFGFRHEVEEFIALSDLMCLPSHREGFGGVVIQAAALGVPTIGTQIYALKDAIQDGVTGLLVPVLDVSALREALSKLYRNRDLLKKLGEQSRDRAEKRFDSRVVNQAVAAEYRARVKSRTEA